MRKYIDILSEISENPTEHEFHMTEFNAVLRKEAVIVHTSGANKTGVPWTLVKHSGAIDTYGVLENGDIIGAIIVLDGPVGRQIDVIATRPDRRNQGVMRFIIDWITDNEGPLLSSNNQTTAAKTMWQALISMPMRRRFYAIDPADPTVKTPLDKKNLDLPWEDT